MSEYPILDTIVSPEDVKALPIDSLELLAKEVRARIIDVVSKTGGHLASNLGATELTIALHYVFNSPQDKLIFDTSHQSYVHKLLTGRHPDFPTVRQHKGLCGFTHPDESPHDHFHAGHAGTALSLGLGAAHKRDLLDEEGYVIPILGDATLTCGVTLEALNNIQRDMKKFIVILNDNAMSISAAVGRIRDILSRMMSNPTTNRLYQEMDSLVSKIPSYGDQLSRQGKKVTESLKNLVSPAAFFEEFGLSYIGPIDGHDVRTLIKTLEGVRDSNWPVIIHCRTVKGQGMTEAVNAPTKWHGAKPFDPSTCKVHTSASTKPTFPKVFGRHLLEMAKKDETMIAVTPAMSAGSCLDEMMATFPKRCVDVGIAESHAVTFAGGLAHGKKAKVVMSVYATFLQRALDNLYHDVCIQENPVVFALDRAGIASGDGRTHQGIYDIAFLQEMPNMIITQPRDAHVLKELMESAFSWKQPVAIRYPNLPTTEPELPIQPREVGRGEVLARGEEILIIALGHTCQTALEVREQMIEEGTGNPTVMDPVFVKPLDSELLCELLMTHDKVVTIEEHAVLGGLGSVLNNFLMTNGYNNLQVLNCGVPDCFVDQGSHKLILEELGLDKEGILKRMKAKFSIHSPSLSHA